MKIKKILKIIGIGVVSLIVIILIVFSFPRVSNPSPPYQTELGYGQALPNTIQEVLTPDEKPQRERAIIVLDGEKIIYEYGPTDKIMNVASMRKSLIGLLYGIAIDKGLIDIHKTLAELGIDEYTPLTDEEKTATIEDLLMAKSGVYLPSQGEHDSQITQRPDRGSHKPGSYFHMNNFDANALGTIFIQETGISLGEFMEENLAKPLGMQDFSEDNVIVGDPWFWPKKKSMHKQYYMYLSARDLVRIGAMVGNKGRWNGRQVISEKWIQASVTSYSNLKENHINYGLYDGFGYQWWLSSDMEAVWTDGYGGHFMIINPEHNFTMVERNFSGNSYLSTGLWLLKKDRSSGLNNLIEAYNMIRKEKSGA